MKDSRFYTLLFLFSTPIGWLAIIGALALVVLVVLFGATVFEHLSIGWK